MNDTMHAGGPIVVGVDGSEQSLAAVRWGARTAAGRTAPLKLVHAQGIPSLYVEAWPPPPHVREALAANSREILAAAQEVARAAGAATISTASDRGDAAPVLLNESRTAGMVVLGASGHGLLGDVILGSTATQTAAHAHGPVVVVHGGHNDAPSTNAPVVVGIDGSPVSETALELAFEEASMRGAPLVAVHTWHDNDAAEMLSPEAFTTELGSVQGIAERLLAERLAGWGEKYPDVVVERVVERARPAHKLVELSKQAQLVVVGSRGRGGFTGLLLGSTSQTLSHHAACPVMIARPASGNGTN